MRRVHVGLGDEGRDRHEPMPRLLLRHHVFRCALSAGLLKCCCVVMVVRILY